MCAYPGGFLGYSPLTKWEPGHPSGILPFFGKAIDSSNAPNKKLLVISQNIFPYFIPA